MDSLIEILTNYGYVGMLISAFLAGSIFPLSSEVVMLALLAAGLDPWAASYLRHNRQRARKHAQLWHRHARTNRLD